MLSLLLPLATEPESTHVELPIPAIGFGIMALVFFAFGLLALWSFRGTAYRSQAAKDHDVAGTRPGTTHEQRGDAGTTDREFEDVGMTETGALKRETPVSKRHDGHDETRRGARREDRHEGRGRGRH